MSTVTTENKEENKNAPQSSNKRLKRPLDKTTSFFIPMSDNFAGLFQQVADLLNITMDTPIRPVGEGDVEALESDGRHTECWDGQAGNFVYRSSALYQGQDVDVMFESGTNDQCSKIDVIVVVEDLQENTVARFLLPITMTCTHVIALQPGESWPTTP